MSNLARKLQQEQEKQQQTVKAPKPVKAKKFWLSPGEAMLGLLFGAAFSIGAVQIVSNQAGIYGVNKEIQQVETAIQEQKKVNSDLDMQVRELSSYERIVKKAEKLGLQRNESNIKVVED